MQKVLENGGEFFVVSTVYEAEKLEISEKEDSDLAQWENGMSRAATYVFHLQNCKTEMREESWGQLSSNIIVMPSML